MKSIATIDYAVIAAYMLLMLGIGIFSMRFNRGASDYFKGGGRIHWLAAGMSSYMSGFSAWTFTGAAGLAYQHGIIAILIYLGNAACFLLGYAVFARRWRRARIGTVMEYLVDRFDERTRQAFSWTTIVFQLFIGASQLYGLALFVAPACGWPLGATILGSGVLTLVSCVIGGLWAVIITDFLQAVILVPFTIVMLFACLQQVGGVSGLVNGLPPELTSLSLTPDYGWAYLATWTVMVSFGYNTAAMAQRYFSVEDERAAKKVALLCFALFALGAFIWFVPPLAMRVLRPEMKDVWPGLANPHESSYALAALTVLPNGLIGIMMAAMFSATVSGLTGLLNLHASIISRDIFPHLFPARAKDAEKLALGWIATFVVGAIVVALAMTMAQQGQSVFAVMLTFNTVMSLAYGPPALLGLLVRRTPYWSGLASFAVALVLGTYGTFVLKWGLVTNVVVVIPAAVAVFFLSALVGRDDAAQAARRARLFDRLDTPVDVEAEVGAVPDRTTEVFRFMSRTTAAVGVLSLLLLGYAEPAERSTVIGYAAMTLGLALVLSRVRGDSTAVSFPPSSARGSR